MGSGIASQFGASRLLYGMGRGNALPARFFAAVHAKTGFPRNNVLLVGACMLAGVFLLTYEKGAELLNFGAFIAFMGVTWAIVHYKIRAKNKVKLALLMPLAGLLIDLFIWLNLSHSAQLLGILWIAAGLALFLSCGGPDRCRHVRIEFESN